MRLPFLNYLFYLILTTTLIHQLPAYSIVIIPDSENTPERLQFINSRDNFIIALAATINTQENGNHQFFQMISNFCTDHMVKENNPLYLAQLFDYAKNMGYFHNTIDPLIKHGKNLEFSAHIFTYRLNQSTIPINKPIVAFKIFNNDKLNTKSLFYYSKTRYQYDNTTDEALYRGIKSDECFFSSCPFEDLTNQDLAKYKKDYNLVKVVRFLDFDEEQPSMKEEQPPMKEVRLLRKEEHPLRKKDLIMGLNLVKTGEIFTTPEIYTVIKYYKDKQLINEVKKSLPWVNGKKNINPQNSVLLDWPSQSDKAIITIMEQDMELPIDAIINFTTDVASTILNEDSEQISRLSEIVSAIFKTNDWGADDYIGTIIIDRNSTDTVFRSIERSATLYLKAD